MLLLRRLTEILESAARLVAARGSRVAALEKFYSSRTPAERASTSGVFDADFGEAKPGLVSVIILTLNGAEMLASLFRSISEHNSWREIEFLVVDHGGDEETRRVLAGVSSEFDIRHLVPGRNFSFSFSCNRAAQIARGETLLFLNNDIEFTGDVIPEMVSAVQATEGLVGLKLWQKSPEGDLSEAPQIGIRFRWNLQQGWTVPYEGKPGPADGLRAVRPAVMPAVTAAILACSRERFLVLGGFPENYLYAYEDVDLGLKASASAIPSISLNNLSATHIVGATRFRRARRARRRRWHRYNLAVFRERCGYRCRRLAWTGLFGGDGFDWGRRPAMALIARSSGDAPRLAGGAFAFIDRKSDGLLGCNLYGYDLVLSCDPAFDFSHARHLSPMAVRVGWARHPEGWSERSEGYDLLLAADESTATELAARTGRPVGTLKPDDGSERLARLVREYLRETHRVVLVGSGEERGRLAGELRRLGISVRLESAASYPSSFAMRDDFAIWLEPPRLQVLPPDTCHIVAFDLPEGASWRGDIHVGPSEGEFHDWFELLRREMEGYHAGRMAGPADAPLEGATLRNDSEAASFWNGFVDPTEWLIGSP